MLRLLLLCLTLLGIVACSSTEFNPTSYAFEYHADLGRQPIKQVMIAPFNFGPPSRHYLATHEFDVDESVKAYLKSNQFTVSSNKPLISIWKKTQLEFGNAYNPTTGEMTSAYKPALKSALTQLFNEHPQLDAIIFTDLIESPVYYKNGSKRIAEWNGVRRKVKIEGIDDALTTDFNWAQSVDGISIVMYVFNRQQQLVQHSVGGIQIAQALKINNKSGNFVRRNDLLISESEILEGIQLALHPWISMQNYPGNNPHK